MKILETCIKHLADRLDAPVSTDVPENRPDRFATVEYGFGNATAYDQTATLAVQAWCRDREALEGFAEEVADALLAMETDIDWVFSVGVQMRYFPETKPALFPRYVITATFHAGKIR